jgi:hypothetical protein
MNTRFILSGFAAFTISLLFAGSGNAMSVGANMKPDVAALVSHEVQFPSKGVNGNSVQDILATLSPGHTSQGHVPPVHVPQGSFLIGAGLATEVQQNLKNEIARSNSRFGSTSVVPIPAAVWLLASGLSFLAFFGRRNAQART